MSEQLDHLIQTLREMDYNTWSKIDAVIREHLIITPSGPDHLTDWIISGCIQEAAAARGWSWDVYAITGENVRGSISLDKKIIDFDGRATAPAEALLRAYIAALEAQQGAEK